jgi:hypothetical protein
MNILLNVYDYLVISLVLGVSILIGLYYAIEAKYGAVFSKCQKAELSKSEGQQMDNYLLGGKQMTAIP